MMNSKDETQHEIEDIEDGIVEDGTVPISGACRDRLGFNEDQFPYILTIATSAILLIAVLAWEEDPIRSRGYVISVPTLSLIMSIGIILMMVFRENLYVIYGQYVSQILFLWNFVGACVLTFSSPFTTTGNGYFAAWACVATSAMAMGVTGDMVRSRIEGFGPLMGLCASSVVVVIALLDYLGNKDYAHKETIYALVVSCLTIAGVAGILFYQKRNSEFGGSGGSMGFLYAKAAFLCVFALLWLFLACLVTFFGPFEETGNGYFASWAGAACVLFAASAAFKETRFSSDTVTKYLSGEQSTGLSSTIS